MDANQPFLGVSDVVWQAFIAGAVAVILAWMQKETRRAVDKVAAKTELSTLKIGLALSDLAYVSDATHTLCNSAMLEQKRILAGTARAKAEITRDPVDLTAADIAERSYADHVSSQKIVDRGQKAS